MQGHETRMILRFGDCDPAGVIFYPRAFELAHAAVEDFIRCSPIGWERWFASPEQAAPIRHAEAEFIAPISPGDAITLRVAIEQSGETSVTFAVDFLDAAGRVAVRVRTVHVLIDKATGRPAALAAEMRRVFGATGEEAA